MKIVLYIFLSCTIAIVAKAQKPAYQIFDAKGKKVNYQKMVKGVAKADILLFGELHNNPIAHWLQLELTKKLHGERSLILGAEMLEADNQLVLNDYLDSKIDKKALDTLARLWPNYKTDYAPLVNFAKDEGLAFVASNIPRRYANMVYKKGFEVLDSLSNEEKSWIAPLPIAYDKDLPRYKNILNMMGEHGTPELVKAQAIKDATMAHFILENYKSGSLFIHYNGAYHSDFYEGIVWYLKQQQPDLSYKTISTVSQGDIDKLEGEYKGQADYIICVDEDMTKTY